MNVSSPGLRSSSIRRQNLATVARLLHLHGPLSRSAIGQQTGLTRSSIATLVGDLSAMGLAAELAPNRDGTRGRPSPVVHPLGDTNFTVGIDLMVDSIGVALVGIGGATLRSMRRDRTRDHRTPEASIREAGDIAQRLLADLPSNMRCFGIGVGVPGLVEQPSQRVVLAPNLGWNDVDVAPLLRSHVDNDWQIAVANEADLGALAESRRGSATGEASVLYVSGEVGVGGGLVSNGRLLTGRRGFAGEIGHIPINPNGSRCGCGSIGCFETELGEAALLQRAGIEPTGRAAVDELIRLAEAGDQSVLDALEAHARWLAFGLSSPQRLLDLDAVVLGGFLGRIHPLIEATLSSALAERSLVAGNAVPVRPAALGENATLIGAAELVWDLVLDDPEMHAELATSYA